MKIAIVQDELIRKGGAEQVTLSLHRAFPQAPIYTLSYNAEDTYPDFRSCRIKTSWFGRYVKKEKGMKRLFFPFGVWAMQQLRLEGYDVVLQSTTNCAKYIKTEPHTLVITYCHTPFRLVWRPDTYEQVARAGFLKKKLYQKVISKLKNIDKKAAERTDWFITNSREVVPRIKAAYNPENDVAVIHPPVKCRKFYISDTPGDYYLVVSRFEPYKKVDLVIETFNNLPDKKLVIVGTGSREKELREMAKGNISFLSGLTAGELADMYAGCKAFIFPQLEDYGITPLEANASGRPVIAFGKGGVRDTMIPVNPEGNESEWGFASRATAVFFYEQNTTALKGVLDLFEQLDFDPDFIRSHAETFDEQYFIEKIKDFVNAKFHRGTYVPHEEEHSQQVIVS